MPPQDSGTGDSGMGDSGTGDSGTGDSGMGDAGAGDGGMDGGLSMRASGEIVLYTFEEGSGSTVMDRSATSPALDLTIEDPGNVSWTVDGLRIDSETRLLSAANADKINQACQSSGEITVEAWISPSASVMVGPARVITHSNGTTLRNFLLGQGVSVDMEDRWTARLRTSDASTDGNGRPDLLSALGTSTASRQHLVYVRRSNGTEEMLRDSVQIAQSTRPGNFSNWVSYPLALGNEVVGSRPWLGTFHLVAVYCRALSAGEISTNFSAGP